jgi:hypothetical protein
MSSLKPTLNATVVSVTTRFSGATRTDPVNIPNFRGIPLFCHADSHNGVLVIRIDETGPNSEPPANAATSADIGIAIGRNPPVPLQFPIRFLGGSRVKLTIRLTPDLRSAMFFIEDLGRVVQQDDRDLCFVLVQEETPDAFFRLEFIVPMIPVGRVEERATAGVVPFSPAQQQPGVIGPMGIVMP